MLCRYFLSQEFRSSLQAAAGVMVMLPLTADSPVDTWPQIIWLSQSSNRSQVGLCHPAALMTSMHGS